MLIASWRTTHMSEETPQKPAEQQIMERLSALEPTKRQRALRKFVAAALGSIPWIGGFMAAMIAMREEEGQLHIDALQREWLEEHKVRMEALALELAALTNRLDSFGDDISDRLESEEYLGIVRKGFRLWDQADADLYRLLVGDLSQGRIIRQHRETNYQGEFIKKSKPPTPRGTASPIMKSAFDDDEPYELTELGKRFVHYVFADIVKRIDS